MNTPRAHGFTLIQLLVTLTIIATLTTLAAPSFTHLIKQNRSTALVNQLRGMLHTARTQAVYSNRVTTLCPTRDYINCSKDWHDSIMVFVDKNRNQIIEDEDILLRTLDPIPEQGSLSWRSFQSKYYIQYSPTGFTRNQNGTFIICSDAQDNRTARLLIINRPGRIRSGQDRDGDGVQERSNGNPATCA